MRAKLDEMRERRGTSRKHQDDERDAIADGPAARRSAVQQQFMETWMGGGSGGGGGSTNFAVTCRTGSGVSGGDAVQIDASSGASWTFDDDQLEDIVDGRRVLALDLRAQRT